MSTKLVTGAYYAEMVRAGATNLKIHAQEVNDLNVFPIPDGDTGDNMLMTMLGGSQANVDVKDTLAAASSKIATGMLLGARGNSGVILSQFFDGIAAGFKGKETADIRALQDSFLTGVKHAYNAVMDPTEGTILTVARESSEYAASKEAADVKEFFVNFLLEAEKSLARTPDLLPVLKKAGVIDSGGKGLIYVMEGMKKFVSGEEIGEAESADPLPEAPHGNLNLDLFDENSELEFGYCTELLIRLQTKKVDIESFDENVIKNYLSTIGNSIVCFKNGSIVKLHVHTMTPDKVLAFCQQFGEFLTLKIENMSLQHNNVIDNEEKASEEAPATRPHQEYAVVAVASGEGVKEAFVSQGADVIVDGGQSMNPSSEDFIKAFDSLNADTIFVLPNNGNIILAARQAASMYEKADVRVVDSHSIGDGYAALSMFDSSIGDADAIMEELEFAMDGVVTASVSLCVRDAQMDGLDLHTGDYIGFIGKDLLSCSTDRKEATEKLIDRLDFTDHEVVVIIRGKDSTEEEAESLQSYVEETHKGVEVYPVDGMQDIYSYIVILM